MAKIMHDDGTFADLTPEEFEKVKEVARKMMDDFNRRKGKGAEEFPACEPLVGRHVFVDVDPDAELVCRCGAYVWNEEDSGLPEVLYYPAFLVEDEDDGRE